MTVHLKKKKKPLAAQFNQNHLFWFYFKPVNSLIVSNPRPDFSFGPSRKMFKTQTLASPLFNCTLAALLMLPSLIPLMPVPMEELHSLDPRRQELLEARFTGAVTGNTAGSTGSTSGGAKVTETSQGQETPMSQKSLVPACCLNTTNKTENHEAERHRRLGPTISSL